MPKIMMNSGRIKVFFTTRRKLVNSIKEQGYEITIGGFEKENKHLCDENEVNFAYIPFARAGLNPFADLKVIKLYEKIIRQEKFDIVHSYTAKPNIYGSIAAKRAGVKKIYPTVNGLGYAFTDDTSDGMKSRIVRMITSRLYKKAFSCATKVFFQNADDADEMVKRKLISREKCVVISGSGIDLDMFLYSEMSVEPITFMLATRLLVTKGVRNYFEAARIVKKKHPEAVFQLAGALDPNPDGIKQEELDDYIRDGTIEFLGYVDMTKALCDCSVFVLPSYYREGVPHAVLEAMGVGRAIITCNTPGCKETVRDADDSGKGKNGFLVEPKNSQMLADIMIWMIEHSDEVKTMGLESRKYAEDRFDVEKVNKVMMDTMGIG